MENDQKVENLHENTISDYVKQLKDKQFTIESIILYRLYWFNRNSCYEYKSNWSWVSKIVFIVKQANKPLRSSEIIEELAHREPVLQTKRSKEQFVSAFLNLAMQHQRLITYKLKGVRGYYYCLPEWINGEKELLQEMRRKIY